MKNLFTQFNIYSTNELQIHYENHTANKGRAFWFTPGALQFFRSTFDGQVYADSEQFYFVSSEKGPDNKRRYSIRTYNPKTGEIDTLGKFQGYNSQTAAKSAIKTIEGINK